MKTITLNNIHKSVNVLDNESLIVSKYNNNGNYKVSLLYLSNYINQLYDIVLSDIISETHINNNQLCSYNIIYNDCLSTIQKQTESLNKISDDMLSINNQISNALFNDNQDDICCNISVNYLSDIYAEIVDINNTINQFDDQLLNIDTLLYRLNNLMFEANDKIYIYDNMRQTNNTNKQILNNISNDISYISTTISISLSTLSNCISSSINKYNDNIIKLSAQITPKYDAVTKLCSIFEYTSSDNNYNYYTNAFCDIEVMYSNEYCLCSISDISGDPELERDESNTEDNDQQKQIIFSNETLDETLENQVILNNSLSAFGDTILSGNFIFDFDIPKYTYTLLSTCIEFKSENMCNNNWFEINNNKYCIIEQQEPNLNNLYLKIQKTNDLPSLIEKAGNLLSVRTKTIYYKQLSI